MFKNNFKKIIKRVTGEASKIEKEILMFSDSLKDVIGLSDGELKIADDEDITFDTKHYTIVPTSRPQYRWKIMLEAIPKGVDTKCGYSNTTPFEPPFGWYYEPRGTATRILPSGDDRIRILNEVATERGA